MPYAGMDFPKKETFKGQIRDGPMQNLVKCWRYAGGRTPAKKCSISEKNQFSVFLLHLCRISCWAQKLASFFVLGLLEGVWSVWKLQNCIFARLWPTGLVANVQKYNFAIFKHFLRLLEAQKKKAIFMVSRSSLICGALKNPKLPLSYLQHFFVGMPNLLYTLPTLSICRLVKDWIWGMKRSTDPGTLGLDFWI